MKLNFDFLGMADLWRTNSGFLAVFFFVFVFFVKLEGAFAVFGDGQVTLKSSNDSERPLGVVSGLRFKFKIEKQRNLLSP